MAIVNTRTTHHQRSMCPGLANTSLSPRDMRTLEGMLVRGFALGRERYYTHLNEYIGRRALHIYIIKSSHWVSYPPRLCKKISRIEARTSAWTRDRHHDSGDMTRVRWTMGPIRPSISVPRHAPPYPAASKDGSKFQQEGHAPGKAYNSCLYWMSPTKVQM